MQFSLLTKSLFCFSFRLHFVFNQSLLHALDLIDQKKVIKLITTSGRVLYQVGKFCAKLHHCKIDHFAGVCLVA